jgi:hypothetical protein
MRRQMRDRALAGLDKLEVLQRSALSGGPMSAPSLAGDLPAPSEAGGAPGAEDDFQYQPTKVGDPGWVAGWPAVQLAGWLVGWLVVLLRF